MAKLPESFDPKTTHPGWGPTGNTNNVGTQNPGSDNELIEQQKRMEAEIPFHKGEYVEPPREVFEEFRENSESKLMWGKPRVEASEPATNAWGNSSPANNISAYNKHELVQKSDDFKLVESSDRAKQLLVGRPSSKKYPFSDMNVGQSFFIGIDAIKETTIRAYAYTYGKKLHRKFKVVIHRDKNTYEIARIL